MEKYDYFILLASSRSGHNYVRSNILSWLGTTWDKKDIVYLNWENIDTTIYHGCLERYITNSNNYKILTVVLIRDFLNWLASYIVMLSETFYENPHWDSSSEPPIKETISIIIKSWAALVKEHYGEINYTPFAIKILYDDFFKDRIYRINICDKIGGEYNEDYLNIITQAGGGSSFDKFNYQKNAQAMNPFNRYIEILDTEYCDLYLETLKNHKHIIKLYRKYFNIDEDKKNFLKNVR